MGHVSLVWFVGYMGMNEDVNLNVGCEKCVYNSEVSA